MRRTGFSRVVKRKLTAMKTAGKTGERQIEAAGGSVRTCIKICIDPQCAELLHNCPKKFTRCKNCRGVLVEINRETYRKKFRLNFFQYDFVTGDFVHHPVKNFQPDLFGG